MIQYILRRFLLMLPTLLGITLVTFVIINLAPGGPIEQKLQQIQEAQASGGMSDMGTAQVTEEVIEDLRKQYGFDKPLSTRYFIWIEKLWNMDFGQSFTYEEPAYDVIVSKFPVSLQFGIASLILVYLICIPLGVYKAVNDGSSFDVTSSFLLFVMYSIVPFMFGILLITFFSSDSFLDLFPIGGLVSDNYEDLSFWEQIKDRVHHFVLPLASYMIGSFTTLTFLMKNSLLEEVKKDYVRTAKAKGLDKSKVYLKHALRNSLIPVVTGLGGFLSIFFAGSLLIETIFQLDGIGLLGYNSILARDYNVIMGLVFLQAIAMLVGNLISDLAYVVVDPRINFK
ncbi:MAG: ABC transporter permease subunit [Bdellovibrionota bacterium]|nr:ABC transporter permease subunit [Bdellovibrionota bacterium]